MTKEQFKRAQYNFSVQSGMNQLYHQKVSGRWKWWDTTCKIAVGFLAVGGLCFSVAAVATGDLWLNATAISVASLSALGAVALNVLPFAEWSCRHNALFQRWTDLREDVDSLLFDFSGEPTQELITRLKLLDGRIHRICGTEPDFDELLRESCYDAEVRSRHADTRYQNREQASATG